MLTIGFFAIAVFGILGSVCWACLQEKNPKGSRDYTLLIEDEAQVAELTAETPLDAADRPEWSPNYVRS